MTKPAKTALMPTTKPRLTQVILERELEVRLTGRKKGKVLLRFGKPQPFPDGRDFMCVFRIDGLHEKPITRRAYGVDSIQALLLAIDQAVTYLVLSAQYKAGRLTWLGMFDFGLPVPKTMRDLIRKDPKAKRRMRQPAKPA